MQYIDAFYNKVSRLFPAPFRVDYLRFGFMPSAGVNIWRLGSAERCSGRWGWFNVRFSLAEVVEVGFAESKCERFGRTSL